MRYSALQCKWGTGLDVQRGSTWARKSTKELEDETQPSRGIAVSILLSFGLWSYRGEAPMKRSLRDKVMVEGLSQPFKQLNDSGAQGWKLESVHERMDRLFFT